MPPRSRRRKFTVQYYADGEYYCVLDQGLIVARWEQINWVQVPNVRNIRSDRTLAETFGAENFVPSAGESVWVCTLAASGANVNTEAKGINDLRGVSYVVFASGRLYVVVTSEVELEELIEEIHPLL